MITSTISPELLFFVRFEELFSARHPGLQLRRSPLSSREDWPLPDVVISNPRTGAALGAEVRVGYQAKALPMTLLPHVDKVRKRLRADYDPAADVVIITTGEVPQPLRRWLDDDGVEYFEISSPEEAMERLEPWLERL
ncbi:MAG: hypothetical protein JO306_09820 [Gemmatimonadetes bacterium]|nr:hypothetical protein [Gemmatimonadota bacterium]